jgi:hypothetical protein
MDNERFVHLRNLVGYDNLRLARSLNVDLLEIEGYCSGEIAIPAQIADHLELFVDWASEVGDTRVKKELAKKHLGGA